MKELLPGQNPAEMGAGGLPFLGSGSEVGAAAEFRRAGMVDESNPAEMGAGAQKS